MIQSLVNYAFEPIETERIMSNPLYIQFFSKPQLMIPAFKKVIKVSSVLNFFSCLMYMYYLIIRKNEKQKLSNFQISFSIYFVLQSLISTILETFIMAYNSKQLQSEMNISILKRRLRKLLVSRIHVCYTNIECLNKILLFILTIIFVQLFQTKSNSMSTLFVINFMTCSLYLFKQIWAIKIYQDSYYRRISNKSVRKTIRQLKLVQYHTRQNFKYTECKICFENFQQNDQLIEVCCEGKHIFHKDCIKNWFRQKVTCPICKKFN